MIIREALIHGRRQLSFSPSPALDARLLLQHVLGSDHSYLIIHEQQSLTPDQEAHFRELLHRAAGQEPIPYLIGQAPFYGLDFAVSPAVLIPRPETELLLETAVQWATQAGRPNPHIVDVGTGSGCLVILLARQLPEAKVEATDISAAALEIARANAQRYQLETRIHFHQGHLLEPVIGRPDLVVANLPYIADDEWTVVDDAVKWYEPGVALRGGPDGLDLIRQLLAQAAGKVNTGGAIMLEIGWHQGRAACRLAQSYFPLAQVELLPDFAGRDRVVRVSYQ
jgi:release factor glutamine methyltransferase